MIVEDPDAKGPPFTHWLIYNMPASLKGLPAGVPPVGKLPNGAEQGVNGWNKTGYGAPCPPVGTHRYMFHLYAVDQALTLAPGATRTDLSTAMRGHVVTEGDLIGTAAH
jgi:Raf kinase inhibitor-like YbhB/YbcL family protein